MFGVFHVGFQCLNIPFLNNINPHEIRSKSQQLPAIVAMA
jgi:hypothetical protein